MNEMTALKSCNDSGWYLPEDVFSCIFTHITDDTTFNSLSSTCKRIYQIAYSIPLYQFHPALRTNPYIRLSISQFIGLGISPLIHFVNSNDCVNELIKIGNNRALTSDEVVFVNLIDSIYNYALVYYTGKEKQNELLNTEKELSESLYNSFESFCFQPNTKINILEHVEYMMVLFNTILIKAEKQGINKLKLGNMFPVFQKKYEEACSIDFRDRISAFSEKPSESITIEYFCKQLTKLTNQCESCHIQECDRNMHLYISHSNMPTLFNSCVQTNHKIILVQVTKRPECVERFFRNALLKHREEFKKIAVDCLHVVPSKTQIVQRLISQLKVEKSLYEKEIVQLISEIYKARLKVEDLEMEVRRLRNNWEEISEDLYVALDSAKNLCDELECGLRELYKLEDDNRRQRCENELILLRLKNDVFCAENQILQGIINQLNAKKTSCEKEVGELRAKISDAKLKAEVLENEVNFKRNNCEEISEDLYDSLGSALNLCRSLEIRLNRLAIFENDIIIGGKLFQIYKQLHRIHNDQKGMAEVLAAFYTELCKEVTEDNELERHEALDQIIEAWEGDW